MTQSAVTFNRAAQIDIQTGFTSHERVITMDMSFNSRFNRTKLDNIMSPEQFDQVVEAILAGKYSWACVLILRFAGYNPLHYIPYRTYNRLMKDNRQGGGLSRRKINRVDTNQEPSDINPTRPSSEGRLSKITDLSYLEPVNKPPQMVQGGAATKLLRDLNPLIVELAQDQNRESSLFINLDVDRLSSSNRLSSIYN